MAKITNQQIPPELAEAWATVGCTATDPTTGVTRALRSPAAIPRIRYRTTTAEAEATLQAIAAALTWRRTIPGAQQTDATPQQVWTAAKAGDFTNPVWINLPRAAEQNWSPTPVWVTHDYTTPYAYRDQEHLPSSTTWGNPVTTTGNQGWSGQTTAGVWHDTTWTYTTATFWRPGGCATPPDDLLMTTWNYEADIEASARPARTWRSVIWRVSQAHAHQEAEAAHTPPTRPAQSTYIRQKPPGIWDGSFSAASHHTINARATLAQGDDAQPHTQGILLAYGHEPSGGKSGNNNDWADVRGQITPTVHALDLPAPGRYWWSKDPEAEEMHFYCYASPTPIATVATPLLRRAGTTKGMLYTLDYDGMLRWYSRNGTLVREQQQQMGRNWQYVLTTPHQDGIAIWDNTNKCTYDTKATLYMPDGTQRRLAPPPDPYHCLASANMGEQDESPLESRVIQVCVGSRVFTQSRWVRSTVWDWQRWCIEDHIQPHAQPFGHITPGFAWAYRVPDSTWTAQPITTQRWCGWAMERLNPPTTIQRHEYDYSCPTNPWPLTHGYWQTATITAGYGPPNVILDYPWLIYQGPIDAFGLWARDKNGRPHLVSPGGSSGPAQATYRSHSDAKVIFDAPPHMTYLYGT